MSLRAFIGTSKTLCFALYERPICYFLPIGRLLLAEERQQ